MHQASEETVYRRDRLPKPGGFRVVRLSLEGGGDWLPKEQAELRREDRRCRRAMKAALLAIYVRQVEEQLLAGDSAQRVRVDCAAAQAEVAGWPGGRWQAHARAFEEAEQLARRNNIGRCSWDSCMALLPPIPGRNTRLGRDLTCSRCGAVLPAGKLLAGWVVIGDYAICNRCMGEERR